MALYKNGKTFSTPLTHKPLSGEPTIKQFLEGIGTAKRLREIFTQMNTPVSLRTIEVWKKENEMPLFAYQALVAVSESLSLEEKNTTAGAGKADALEIYIDDLFLGRLELPRNVTIKIKRTYKFK